MFQLTKQMFSASQLQKASENAGSPARQALNAPYCDSQSDNPELCEAKRENPFRGSFLSGFTLLPNQALNNRKQLPKMDQLSQKHSSTALWTVPRRVRKFVKGLQITAPAHPVTQRMQKQWAELISMLVRCLRPQSQDLVLVLLVYRTDKLETAQEKFVICKMLHTDSTSQNSSSWPPVIQTTVTEVLLSWDECPTHKLQHWPQRGSHLQPRFFSWQLHTLNQNLHVFHFISM